MSDISLLHRYSEAGVGMTRAEGGDTQQELSEKRLCSLDNEDRVSKRVQKGACVQCLSGTSTHGNTAQAVFFKIVVVVAVVQPLSCI